MYEWIKALHVIAVIAWMAGMLYLPRLFVYHCEAEAGSKQSGSKFPATRVASAGVYPPACSSACAKTGTKRASSAGS